MLRALRDFIRPRPLIVHIHLSMEPTPAELDLITRQVVEAINEGERRTLVR